MLSDAALAYLAAFDAYLNAHRDQRDDQFIADLKAEAFEHLIAQRFPDVAAFLREVPADGRGTPDSRNRRGDHL